MEKHLYHVTAMCNAPGNRGQLYHDNFVLRDQKLQWGEDVDEFRKRFGENHLQSREPGAPVVLTSVTYLGTTEEPDEERPI